MSLTIEYGPSSLVQLCYGFLHNCSEKYKFCQKKEEEEENGDHPKVVMQGK